LMVKKTPMDYPNEYFWKLVSETHCKVLLEADAHAAQTLGTKPVRLALNYLKKWNLEKNLISKMKLI
jgi:histidinol phosphatase-like PHP family hydrolase